MSEGGCNDVGPKGNGTAVGTVYTSAGDAVCTLSVGNVIDLLVLLSSLLFTKLFLNSSQKSRVVVSVLIGIDERVVTRPFMLDGKKRSLCHSGNTGTIVTLFGAVVELVTAPFEIVRYNCVNGAIIAGRLLVDEMFHCENGLFVVDSA